MKLLFNIGGTNTRIAVAESTESIDNPILFSTQRDFSRQIVRMKDEADKLAGGNRWEIISGGVPGVFDSAKNKLTVSPNLPEWVGIPIKKIMEEKLETKVLLENDAQLEAIGEANLGAGRRKQSVAYLTIGTGIGGALIIDGKPVSTYQGFEPGHQIIFSDDKVGYWEEMASGSAMKLIYGKEAKDISEEKIWEDETRLLALGINNVIVLWSPEIVILGGGLMNRIDLKKLTAIIKEQLTIFPKCPEIARAELGEKSGLYGALIFSNL